MTTLVAAIIVLGAVIFVHELGHFLAAKATGVGVARFSIGFGPTTPLKFRRGETEYAISWFPLGGYVMMASEEEGMVDEASGARALEGGPADRPFPRERMFESKPLWTRIVVISAGVIMNVVFAWLIYTTLALAFGEQEDPTTMVASVDSTILPQTARALARVEYPARIVRINGDAITSWNAIGAHLLDPTRSRLEIQFADRAEPVLLETPGTAGEDRLHILQALRPAWPATIGVVAANRPAALAGIRPGDRVIAAGGDSIRYWSQLVDVVESHPGDTLALAVRRADSAFVTTVVPEAEEQDNPATGEPERVGKIGIGVQVEPRHVHYGFAAGLAEGTRRTLADAGLVIFTVKGLIVGQVSPRELGGPILVGQLSGQLAQVGLEPFLAFIALFSVNLAVLNLLPIPVLDGGRLVFLVAEGIRGRPLSRQVRVRLSQAGAAVLLAIIVLALTNDLLRLFG